MVHVYFNNTFVYNIKTAQTTLVSCDFIFKNYLNSIIIINLMVCYYQIRYLYIKILRSDRFRAVRECVHILLVFICLLPSTLSGNEGHCPLCIQENNNGKYITLQ